MADILLSPALQWALIAGALLFAGLAAFGRTRPLHWALPAGLCTAAAVLDALARGKTLEQALTVALAVAAVSLIGLTRGEGGRGA